MFLSVNVPHAVFKFLRTEIRRKVTINQKLVAENS